MGSTELESALNNYETVLTSLEQADTKLMAEEVLTVLISRDVLEDKYLCKINNSIFTSDF